MLGMIISHDSKGNMHTSELSRKCSSCLCFLRQLKRSGVIPNGLVLFHVTSIRPVLEYASLVFHRSLPNYISEDLEREQREDQHQQERQKQKGAGPRPARTLWPYGQPGDSDGTGQAVGRPGPGDQVHGTQNIE